jgi:hypothetical protein
MQSSLNLIFNRCGIKESTRIEVVPAQLEAWVLRRSIKEGSLKVLSTPHKPYSEIGLSPIVSDAMDFEQTAPCKPQ